MRTSIWIAVGVLVAGGVGSAWWAGSGASDDDAELAAAGEVRGTPLRAPVASDDEPAPSDGAGADGQPASSGAPAAKPEPEEPIGEDYADLLPSGAAGKYEWIDFPLLMDFDFPGLVTDEVEPEDLIPPEEVRELEARTIAIEGFMNPLSFDAEGVSEFTLVADPTFCCFGMTPQLNHFVHVTLPEGERCDFYSMVPVAVFGTFSVGAEMEDGIVLSLYRMQADHVLSVY